jgi:rhamnosyltransferase
MEVLNPLHSRRESTPLAVDDELVNISGSSRVMVIVPTLNAAETWDDFANGLLSNISPSQVLIFDSASTDGTPELARKAGFSVESISRTEFNHGTTRQRAADRAGDAQILVFLTQDAILATPDSLSRLLEAFRDGLVGAAYGRQLPRPLAGPIEAHARHFNYPAKSSVRSIDKKAEVTFKSIFLSNSFAAYRRTALELVGGFPAGVIIGEDTITAARMLLAGLKIAYVAEAEVYHSHEYTLIQEFQRYFDTGVMHAREAWLLREFGGTGGEGLRFLRSELRFCRENRTMLLPHVLLRTAAKFAGYRLGCLESKLRPSLKRRLSMHKDFWNS